MTDVYYDSNGITLHVKPRVMLSIDDDLEGWRSYRPMSIPEMRKLAVALLKCANDIENKGSED